MHNPLRSEADAFRWVVTIAVAAGAVIALSLLTRPALGAALGCLLIGVLIGALWRGSRGSIRGKTPISRTGDSRYRVLVVANETVQGRALLDEIRNRCRGRDSEVLVVTPALTSAVKHWASDVDEAIEQARQRMELSLLAIQGIGVRAKGEVGDSDPNTALRDALQQFPADEVIISTHPAERSKWLERGVVEQAREEVDLPVTHVVVDLEAEAAGQPAA